MHRIFRLSIALWIAALLVSPLALIAPQTPAAAQGAALQDCTLKTGPQGTGELAAKCATVTVPEDWTKPDGRKIDLSVAVVPARNPESKLPPIFHFEGGPGGSAIDMFSMVWYSAYAPLNQDHDIVLIDQRGTGKSASLQCTELTERAFDDLKKDPLVALEETTPLLEACLQRVAQTNDPALFTTAALVEDTNAVRQALGYDKINLFGSSYGTWLAQFYMAKYGDHVSAAVLEGVTGPWDQPFLQAGVSAEAAVKRAFALCESDAACNAVYPDLLGKLQRALEQLEKQPVQVSGVSATTGKSFPVLMTRDRFLEALRNMPAQGSLIGTIPQTVAQAAEGVYLFPATLLISLAEQSEAVSLGLYFSIACAETWAFVSDEEAKAVADSFFGQQKLTLATFREGCKVWRSAEIAEEEVAPIRADVPTLLLAGAFDHITPVSFAEATAKRLPNSALAIFPYQGHAVLPFSGCAQRLAAQIYADPTAKLDVSCAANDVKPVFQGAFRPKLAPFTDPAGRFTANVPEGWTVREGAADGTMTFLSSPDAVPQILGIAVYKGLSGEALHDEARKAVTAAFGPLTLQSTLNSFGVTISQFGLMIDGEVYVGGLVSIGLGPMANALWYAAPSNIFTVGFSDLVMAVFTSIAAR